MDRHIKVCLVANTFAPAFSGAALRFQGYMPHLRDCGIEVEIVCGTPTASRARMAGVPPGSSTSGRMGEVFPPENVGRWPVHRVRLPDQRGWLRYRLLGRRLLDHCRQPESRPHLVQLLTVSMSMTPTLVGLRRLGIPMVYTGTMVVPPHGNLAKRLALRWRRRIPLDRVDRLVVSSSVMAEFFRHLGVSTPLIVIPNGVDLGRFRPPEDPGERTVARARLGLKGDGPLLLNVGAVTPRKGTDLLLQAWARVASRFPTARLVIVGPRQDREDPAYRDFHLRIESLLRSGGAPERVHFPGVVDNVEDYMRAADLFVFPSRREGMGNAVLEAMASGLPVVCTPYLGLPAELGEPGIHYLLADSTVEDLAAAITGLLEDDRQRTGLATSGLARTQGMDHRRSARRYAELYRACVENGGKSPRKGD